MTSEATSAMVSAISTALKDLLKFKIVANVSTGDKTQDSLITTLLLSIVAMIFASFSWKSIKLKIQSWSLKKPEARLTADTLAYYTAFVATKNDLFHYCTWMIDEDKVHLGAKIAKYYFNIYGGTNSKINPAYYDFKLNAFNLSNTKKSANITKLSQVLKHDHLYPMFVDHNGIVCIVKNSENDYVLIGYTNGLTLEAFMSEVNKQHASSNQTDAQGNIARSIFSSDGANLGTIYVDRTFDMFVSRYKNDLLNAIDAFTYANTKGAGFGGYGTYNLGIMLHGEPGTGKTLLIKALANKLQRNVTVVNMRKIKTRTDFENLFKGYKDVIYCLDEFDFVQNVIQQRSDGPETANNLQTDEKEHISKKEIRELKDRQLELLKLTTLSSNSSGNADENAGKKKSTDSGKSPLEQELTNIESRLKNLENALTLDTILTVLDGINEMRGRVIIATTNHLDRIDKALMRAGRFDLKINLGKFNDEEIREMLNHMFKDASAEDLDLINNTKFKEGVFAPVDVIYHATTKKNVADLIQVLRFT